MFAPVEMFFLWLPMLYRGEHRFPSTYCMKPSASLSGKLHSCPWQAAAMHLPSLARTRRNFPFNLHLLRLSGVSLFPSKPTAPLVSPVLSSGNRKATSQEKLVIPLKHPTKECDLRALCTDLI